jgi:hypothetical protein
VAVVLDIHVLKRVAPGKRPPAWMEEFLKRNNRIQGINR